MNFVSFSIGMIFIIFGVLNLVLSQRKRSSVSEKEVGVQKSIPFATVKEASLPSENIEETKIEVSEVRGEYKPLMEKIKEKIEQKTGAKIPAHVSKSKPKKPKRPIPKKKVKKARKR